MKDKPKSLANLVKTFLVNGLFKINRNLNGGKCTLDIKTKKNKFKKGHAYLVLSPNYFKSPGSKAPNWEAYDLSNNIPESIKTEAPCHALDKETFERTKILLSEHLPYAQEINYDNLNFGEKFALWRYASNESLYWLKKLNNLKMNPAD